MQKIYLKDWLKDKSTYLKTKDELLEKLDNNFALRNDLVEVEFNNGEIIEMEVKHLLSNLIFWRPFVIFGKEVTPEDYIDFSKSTKSLVDNNIERLRKKFFTKDISLKLSVVLSEIIEDVSQVSYTFNKLIGNSVSHYSLAKLAMEDKEFYDILNTDLDPSMSSKDIEKLLDVKLDDAYRILSSNDNCFRDYIECGEGLNKNQLGQAIIAVGPKPDMDGNVYPVPVTRSILRGFKNLSDYYIDSTGGRKA